MSYPEQDDWLEEAIGIALLALPILAILAYANKLARKRHRP